MGDRHFCAADFSIKDFCNSCTLSRMVLTGQPFRPSRFCRKGIFCLSLAAMAWLGTPTRSVPFSSFRIWQFENHAGRIQLQSLWISISCLATCIRFATFSCESRYSRAVGKASFVFMVMKMRDWSCILENTMCSLTSSFARGREISTESEQLRHTLPPVTSLTQKREGISYTGSLRNPFLISSSFRTGFYGAFDKRSE